MVSKLLCIHIHIILLAVILRRTQGETGGIKTTTIETELNVSIEHVEKHDSRKGYEVFTIMLGDESEDFPGSSSQAKHVVFRDGQVESHWQRPVEPTKELPSSLFYHGPYVDRISFDFYFGSFPDYDIRKPSVKSSISNIAQPQVIDFQIDEDANTGSYTIVYDCQKRDNSSTLLNTTINVNFPVATGQYVEYAFQKTCGGGYHKYLDFGYFIPSENNGVEATRSTFPTHDMVVGPHVSSTRIFLLLQNPAESQEFFHVTALTGDSSGLSVNIQGPMFGGVLRKRRATLLYVTYDCKKDGKHKVNLTVPLRPFRDLTGTWEKDCGGGVADGLNIGTDGIDESGIHDIVHNGITRKSWLLGLSATSGRIGNGAPIVNTSIRIQDLWISNNGIGVHVAPEVITVEKPDYLSVTASRSTVGHGGGGSDYIGNDGLLATGGKMRLRLRIVCKKKGRSLVLVTLPIKSFQKIDLGFVKECRAPRQYHHSGFLRTANSTMITLSVFLALGTLMCLRIGSVPNKNYKNTGGGRGGINDDLIGRTVHSNHSSAILPSDMKSILKQPKTINVGRHVSSVYVHTNMTSGAAMVGASKDGGVNSGERGLTSVELIADQGNCKDTQA